MGEPRGGLLRRYIWMSRCVLRFVAWILFYHRGSMFFFRPHCHFLTFCIAPLRELYKIDNRRTHQEVHSFLYKQILATKS